VKANTKTGIYHVPGGRFYESVTPQRCYRDAAAAEADGLRPSKR
jgi:methylphosphotriester-DNA--protein-cysteine methyltransferase